jgi:hypothetical protein
MWRRSPFRIGVALKVGLTESCSHPDHVVLKRSLRWVHPAPKHREWGATRPGKITSGELTDRRLIPNSRVKPIERTVAAR